MLPTPFSITLNEMQQAMLDAAVKPELNGCLLLLAPTGTGKTWGYLLPLCRLMKDTGEGVEAIVVVPTRELAIQAETMFRHLNSGLPGICLYGGRPAAEEHKILMERKPRIAFCTPGRLNDHLNRQYLDAKTVRWLVVDEYDKCLEMGFREEVTALAGKLSHIKGCWMTSATTATDAAVLSEQLPVSCGRNGQRPTPFTLNFLDTSQTPASLGGEARITTLAVRSPQRDKLPTLGKLLSTLTGTSCMVFAAHRESVLRIAEGLKKEGFALQPYHGGMQQDQRERALWKFRNGCAHILVATDIAARGLDIPEVGAIVHYHLPADEDAATHRAGRSARWSNCGKAFFLLGPDEELPSYVDPDCKTMDVESVPVRPVGPAMSALYIGRGRRHKLSKTDVLGFLCKKGGARGTDIGCIEVADDYALAAVRSGCAKSILQRVAGEKIKGLKTHCLPA